MSVGEEWNVGKLLAMNEDKCEESVDEGNLRVKSLGRDEVGVESEKCRRYTHACCPFGASKYPVLPDEEEVKRPSCNLQSM